jgi:rSAM/selenodomain-associated transferase 2
VTVSVIIPTLNEESCLEPTLRSLATHHPHEVLVVDGGSTDATRAIAARHARLLDAPPGRATQMNHGAAHATGDVLLFLHADCLLETGALDAAVRTLRRPGVAAGCFRMTVDAPGTLYRLIGAAATARVRLAGLVYGDQGLFITRALFDRVGRFPPLRFLEDVFISRALRRHGRLVVAPRRILVSARRWRQRGLVKQTLGNWSLTMLALAGVHPDWLARYYPTVR